MTREKEKSPLLNGKYELTTYFIKLTDRLESTRIGFVRLDIRATVLAANHPDHPFYDPSDKELNNYKKAIEEVRKGLVDEICNKFKWKQDNLDHIPKIIGKIRNE